MLYPSRGACNIVSTITIYEMCLILNAYMNKSTLLYSICVFIVLHIYIHRYIYTNAHKTLVQTLDENDWFK